jgi:porphobilinogen synthase
MSFPLHRYRRLRRSESLRTMVRETSLAPSDFIAPLFVVPGQGVRQGVSSMPGVDRTSPELAGKDAKALADLGVLSVILFGIPDHKDAKGTSSADLEGPVCRAVRAIKAESPKTVVMTDICLCEYTDHGHCGVIKGDTVDNDPTLAILAAEAIAHAKAGADVVAPSDMMDGRVGAIRDALEEGGHVNVQIMAYAAKYASAFYGPFRDAVGSGGLLKGDKKTYQMDPANAEEALREVELDIAEGADSVMVKPGLPYLDIVRRVKERFEVPVFAYQVSGEYAMIEAAAAAGAGDRDALVLETLLAFRRAGCSGVLTYHAAHAAQLLQGR